MTTTHTTNLVHLNQRQDARARKMLLVQWKRGALSLREFFVAGHQCGMSSGELKQLCHVPVPPDLALSIGVAASPRKTRVVCKLRVLPQHSMAENALLCSVKVTPRPCFVPPRLPPIAKRWPALVPGLSERPDTAEPSTQALAAEHRAQQLVSRTAALREDRANSLKLRREQRTAELKRHYGRQWPGGDSPQLRGSSPRAPYCRDDDAIRTIQQAAQRRQQTLQSNRARQEWAADVIYRYFQSWQCRRLRTTATMEQSRLWQRSATLIQAVVRGYMVPPSPALTPLAYLTPSRLMAGPMRAVATAAAHWCLAGL